MPTSTPLPLFTPVSTNAVRMDRTAAPLPALRVAHSPDPDDAFAWWAWRTGRLGLEGWGLDCRPLPMEAANRACCAGELDVAAVSAAAYPLFSRDYAILATGASVGRGYGPALVARADTALARLAGGLIAVPGETTTGALLARLFVPRANYIALPFEEVAPAVAEGRVDAGVLIHEELLNWQHRGVRLLRCLGDEWTLRTGLPLTVGLVVARRSLGTNTLRRIAATLGASIREGLAHADEAARWARGYSREAEAGIAGRFIEMFTNSDSLALAPECRAALVELWRRGAAAGALPGPAPALEVVEPLEREECVLLDRMSRINGMGPDTTENRA